MGDLYKVCTDPMCDNSGVNQHYRKFYAKGSRCIKCITRERQLKEARTRIWRIKDVDYKVGVHGFVYHLISGKWIKSALSKSELMRLVRNG